MIRQLLAQSPLLVLPLLGLLIFFGVFVLVVVHVYRHGAGEHDALARLPLADDDGAPNRAPSRTLDGAADAVAHPALEKGR